MNVENEIASYEARMLPLLETLDIEGLRALMRESGETPPADDHVMLIAAHKARTAATRLPMALRAESKEWLAARGFESWDDGDVPMGPEAL